MAIKVNRKSWENKMYREAILQVAELFKEDIVVEKIKFKPYSAQIWLNDDIKDEKDFDTKGKALKWIKQELLKKKYKDAFVDLKKYNKSHDDFDYWFYKVVDNVVKEVETV